MGWERISIGKGGGGQWGEDCFPARSSVLFCAVSLLILIPLLMAVVLTDYRMADDFRLVGQIDFPEAFRYFFQTSGFGRNEYRPVVLLSFAWDNLVWGDRAFGYHLTNVLLHTANGVLLLLLFQRLTGNVVLAFFSAALFAFHPSLHSRIAWIAARDGSLSTLFLLISWLLYLSARAPGSAQESERPMRRVRLKRGASAAAFLFALLSYEGAASFPLVLAVMELFLGPHPEPWKERIGQTARRTAPYFVLLALYGAGWLLLFEGKIGSYDLDWTLGGMLRDLRRLLFALFFHVQHWLGLVYLLVALLIWRQHRTHNGLVGFSWMWMGLGYLPFLPVEGFAGRFAYFSAAGSALFLGLCAAGIARGAKGELRSTLLPAALLLGLIGYYAYFTSKQLDDWVEAGRIAETIPTQLKALRPSFPPNATLIFDQIPPMHRNAYVFMNSFRAAVRGKYENPIPQIYYYPGAAELPSVPLNPDDPTFHFRYLPEQERLVEINGESSPAELSR